MITKEQLMEAKNELLLLSKTSNKKKIILEGNNSILLSASVINKMNSRKELWTSRLDNDDNTFASLVYLLSKETKSHALINIINLDKSVPTYEELRDIERKAYIVNFINDETIREYVLNNNIQAIINHLIYYKSNNYNLELTEFNSSFNFGGLTGFSQILDNLLAKQNMKTQLVYTTTPGKEEFDKYGYKFSDEVIERYSRFITLGILLNNKLCSKQMWPRSLEIKGMADIKNNLNDLTTLANVEVDFINEVINDLRENGVHKALQYKKTNCK